MKKELTKQQQEAFDMVIDFLKPLKEETKDYIEKMDKNCKHLTITGYAGVGKTFLIKHLYDHLKKDYKFAFATFTGKAAENLIKRGVHCKTLHSTIYDVREDAQGKVTYEKKETLDREVIVIDESSMLEKEYIEDLETFGKPIIFFGDNFQLPPISGNRPEKLTNFHYEITEVMRNAGVIIENLTKIRNFESLEIGTQKDESNKSSFSVMLREDRRINENLLKFDKVICGTNDVRNMLNRKIREMKGLDNLYPLIGEELICLKNTNKEEVGVDLKNGEIIKIKNIEKGNYPLDGHDTLIVTFNKGKEEFTITISAEMFKDPKTSITKYTYNYAEFKNLVFCDFAYALTAHKSQGSQYEKVLVLAYDMTWLRKHYVNAVYTAAGRAEKHVIIVVEHEGQLKHLTKKY